MRFFVLSLVLFRASGNMADKVVKIKWSGTLPKIWEDKMLGNGQNNMSYSNLIT